MYFYFRDCLHDHIMIFHSADVLCPYNHYDFSCEELITEQEMQEVQTCIEIKIYYSLEIIHR